jgi:hypothetical protein
LRKAAEYTRQQLPAEIGQRTGWLLIEKLPEGVYLATSEDIPGLIAQGRTITETLELARDATKKPLEIEAATD